MSQGQNPSSAHLFEMASGPMGMNPDDAPLVLAYRMGQVENKLDALTGKFDLLATHYVTTSTLMLTLEPVKERLKELEDSAKQIELRKSNEQSQFKLAMAIAIFSPIMAAVVSIVVSLLLKK